MPKLNMTPGSIESDAILPQGKRQVLYSDTSDKRVRGMGLLVGKTTKTWTYQRDLPGGKQRRVTLGEYPTMSLAGARRAAIEMAAKMLAGVDPTAERRDKVEAQQLAKWQKVTLQDAINHHVLTMQKKECSDRGIEMVRDIMPNYLGDWLEKPLYEITAEDCITRHTKISIDNGRTTANITFRNFKACYRDIRKLHTSLPTPYDAITFNKRDRRHEPIWVTMPMTEWWDKVHGITNTVRRDFYLFCLLTGMRSENVRLLTWRCIDLENGTITSPKEIVKGAKAFCVPMSSQLCKLLSERKLNHTDAAEGGNRFSTADDAFVFPSFDMDGKLTFVQEAKQQVWAKDDTGKRLKNAKGKPYKVKLIPTPHRCRDTFLSIGRTRAQVDKPTLESLANHVFSDFDVNDGYITADMGYKRECTQRISNIILDLCEGRAELEINRPKGGPGEQLAKAKKTA